MIMEENPFVVSGRIRPEYFCDRKAESERMIKLLTNGNNVVLKSDRRMGKTGLIQYCFDQPVLHDNYYTFFVDILHTTCLQELVHELGRTVYEQTVPRGKKMVQSFVKALRSIAGKMGFDANTGLPTFSVGLGDIERPEYTLEEIFGYLQQADKPCIVAIDEFQQVAKYPEKNIEALLRGHIQRIDNCRFVFAGSERHMLEQMFNSRNHPFYKSADIMNLGAIDRDVYVEFMCQKFQEKGRLLDAKVAKDVYEMYEGHTYYVQKTMNEAFANTPKGGTCLQETLETAISDILAGNDYYYREQLSRMTIKQKMLLYAIAEEGVAKQITSADFIKRHKLPSASSVQSAIKRLLSEDYVVEDAKQFRVNDRFFSLWIRRLLA
ncbi:MAG: ATP-binding protein [Bacteroidales bacterium]|nr:ATP-binding protein [Bacteroidales bacterium]